MISYLRNNNIIRIKHNFKEIWDPIRPIHSHIYDTCEEKKYTRNIPTLNVDSWERKRINTDDVYLSEQKQISQFLIEVLQSLKRIPQHVPKYHKSAVIQQTTNDCCKHTALLI